MPLKSRHSQRSKQCPKKRLAESEVAAVDLCQCGMFQLHLGAVTVRFTRQAFHELQQTLMQAVTVESSPPAALGDWSLTLTQTRHRGSA